jgi:hypothetical protein
MSRGRSPEKGETALSNAERQARYRDRHKQAPVVVMQSRKPADRRPRATTLARRGYPRLV